MNRFLAQHGGISRRQADRYILEGRAQVNGQCVKELGLRVNPERDEVSLDGVRVSAENTRLYLLLNKPAGYLVTSVDPQGRPTVFDLLEGIKSRIFSVGRLDYDTEGVLLLTNDGELAHRLTHPSHKIIKGYQAKVIGIVDDHKLKNLLKGIRLDDGISRATTAKLLYRKADHSEIYLELTTGKKRQVKRMLAAIGHPVISLRRTVFAGLNTEGLSSGQWRHLSTNEVKRLRSAGR